MLAVVFVAVQCGRQGDFRASWSGVGDFHSPLRGVYRHDSDIERSTSNGAYCRFLQMRIGPLDPTVLLVQSTQ